MPQRSIGCAPGTGNALDVLLLGQVVCQLRAFAGIVVVVLVVVDSPVMMEAGVNYNPVVLTNLKAVLFTCSLKLIGHNDVPDVAHLCGVALGSLPLCLELVLQIAHVNDDAGADAALQMDLSQGVAVGLAVNLLLMEHMVGSVHMSTCMQGAGVGHGSLVEPAQILAAGELQIGTSAGEGPQGGVNAPGLGQVVDLYHLGIVQIHFCFVERHVGHDEFLL